MDARVASSKFGVCPQANRQRSRCFHIANNTAGSIKTVPEELLTVHSDCKLLFSGGFDRGSCSARNMSRYLEEFPPAVNVCRRVVWLSVFPAVMAQKSQGIHTHTHTHTHKWRLGQKH